MALLTSVQLRDLVVQALEDGKGQNILPLDVTSVTDITDFMIIVSGTSNRHVKALVDQVVVAAKSHDNPPLGVEGRETYEWVLLDVGDVLVHVMQTATREFYALERLWQPLPADSTTSN